jgi:rsbT co-antagonist protein RsbR
VWRVTPIRARNHDGDLKERPLDKGRDDGIWVGSSTRPTPQAIRGEYVMAVTVMKTRISEVLERYEAEILSDWMKEQATALTQRPDLMKESELRHQSTKFLKLLREAIVGDSLVDIQKPNWGPVREFIGEVSRSRAIQGFSPSETATFVLSLKQPLFIRLRKTHDGQPDYMFEDLWNATVLLDKLGLYTTEVFLKTREDVIGRQQKEMFELSTPVVELWQGILGLPIIGTIDSKRSQLVMETLLQRIAETQAEVAVIDITGVPVMDTLTAQHLLKTVTATRLMGADCIISGVRPQIAQTLVHLGVNLGDVTTKASLAGALSVAFKRMGLAVGPARRQSGETA